MQRPGSAEESEGWRKWRKKRVRSRWDKVGQSVQSGPGRDEGHEARHETRTSVTRKKHLDTFGILWYMLHHVASCWVDGGVCPNFICFCGVWWAGWGGGVGCKNVLTTLLF